MTIAKEKNNPSPNTDLQNNESVLIVGDWFIDEHWTMGIHRSATSSRTGKRHYRALQRTDSEVRAFCGAGRTAFFLHHVQTRDKKRLFKKLIGLGFWHHEDTDDLYTLFNPTFQVHSPYRLRDKETQQEKPRGLKLINMNDVFMSSDNENNQNAFTNRIIRIYSMQQDGEVTYDRYDWEPRGKPVHWTEKELGELVEKLKDNKPSVIVVKDLLKNSVNYQLIKELANVYKNTRWYISSKKWKPDWLETLKSVSIELLLVPQVAAQEALQAEKITCWLSHSGHPSKEALDTIQDLHDKTNAKSIIVLPEGLSAIARVPGKDNETKCVIQPLKQLKQVKVPMGGQSILFPALCSGIEYAVQYDKQLNIPVILAHAFECTSDWICAEGGRVLQPATWKPDPEKWKPEPALLLDVSRSEGEPKRVTLDKIGNWDREIEAWKSAQNLECLGVIEDSDKGSKELQLRRSMTEVNGYVCWGKEKRQNLRHLVKGINDFHLNPKYPAAAMLVAEPGSGKSFLIKQLAKSACLEPLPFNITHLSSRGEIIGWFDTILTKQQERPDKRFLVFVDEINSDLGGSKPYSAFLSPLEDGFYVRNGQTYPLQPAVWIFAGTKNPAEEGDKGSDFISRLTLGQINLTPPTMSTDEKESERIYLERIYVGAAMLKHTFPDVQYVSEHVLHAFRDLNTSVRVRDIKHFVRQFSNIQYASVTSANVPSLWPKDHEGENYRKWKERISKEEKADITIVW